MTCHDACHYSHLLCHVCLPYATSTHSICPVAVQAHVHQMAVAAGDVYVRVYDRRMLSTGASFALWYAALMRLPGVAPCYS